MEVVGVVNLTFLCFLTFFCIGCLLGVCMCPATLDALDTWIKYMEQRYPSLRDATVVYNVDFDKEPVNQLSSIGGSYTFERQLL